LTSLYSVFGLAADLGDSAVTGGLALVGGLYLFYLKQKRAAVALWAAFVCAGGLIALGKILIYSHCVSLPAFWLLRSPSGHAAISAALYFTLASIIASSERGWRQFVPYAVAFCVVVLVAVSRVVLRAHTEADVWGGLFIGIVVFTVLWLRLIRGHVVPCRRWPFVVMGLVLFVFFYRPHLPSEGFIRWFVNYLSAHFQICS